MVHKVEMWHSYYKKYHWGSDLLILYKQADPPENNSLAVNFQRVCVVILVPLPTTCVVIQHCNLSFYLCCDTRVNIGVKEPVVYVFERLKMSSENAKQRRLDKLNRLDSDESSFEYHSEKENFNFQLFFQLKDIMQGITIIQTT